MIFNLKNIKHSTPNIVFICLVFVIQFSDQTANGQPLLGDGKTYVVCLTDAEGIVIACDNRTLPGSDILVTDENNITDHDMTVSSVVESRIDNTEAGASNYTATDNVAVSGADQTLDLPVFGEVTCNPGYYIVVVSCVMCLPGKYSPAATSLGCLSCGPNQWSGSGASACSSCTTCLAGTFLSSQCTSISNSVCSSCPANSWSGSGDSVCTANAGFYNLDAPANLKAYYTFNQGAFLQDVTGITGNLVASSSSPTSQASGAFGATSYSAVLTGSSNQFFTLPQFMLPNEFSICSWFWISPSITRNWNRIWDFGVGIKSNVLGTVYWTTNDLRLDVYRGDTWIGSTLLTNGAQTVSTWRHVCMTLSGNIQRAWLDGVSTSFTMSVTRNVTETFTTNFIGKSSWANDSPWWGAIDDFRIYHKALTNTEVAALYAFRGDTRSPMIFLPCTADRCTTPVCGTNQYLSTGLVCTPCAVCENSGFFKSGCGGSSAGTCERCINTS